MFRLSPGAALDLCFPLSSGCVSPNAPAPPLLPAASWLLGNRRGKAEAASSQRGQKPARIHRLCCPEPSAGEPFDGGRRDGAKTLWRGEENMWLNTTRASSEQFSTRAAGSGAGGPWRRGPSCRIWDPAPLFPRPTSPVAQAAARRARQLGAVQGGKKKSSIS